MFAMRSPCFRFTEDFRQLAHMNRWGWWIQAAGHLNVPTSSSPLSIHQFSGSAQQSTPLVTKRILRFLFIISNQSNRTRQIGLGVARPISRVTARETNPDTSNLKYWARSDSSPPWLTSPEMLEKMYQSSMVEPIASSPGPNLIDLSNLQRWNLLVHHAAGLIPAFA